MLSAMMQTEKYDKKSENDRNFIMRKFQYVFICTISTAFEAPTSKITKIAQILRSHTQSLNRLLAITMIGGIN